MGCFPYEQLCWKEDIFESEITELFNTFIIWREILKSYFKKHTFSKIVPLPYKKNKQLISDSQKILENKVMSNEYA